MTNWHELDLHVADNTSTNERGEVADEDMVLVFTHAVVDLHHQGSNVGLCAANGVCVEKPGNSEMNGGADEVASCESKRTRTRVQDCGTDRCYNIF